MKNRKKSWYIIITVILLFACILAFMFFKNKITEKNETSKQENQTEQNQYKAEKAAASEQNSTDNSNTNKSNEQNNSVANNQIDESTSNSSGSSNSSSDDLGKQYVETQIATFTTKIYTKDEARQNNMQITASRLNNHVVKNGSTFSFCNTLGPSSTKNGYREADIFDNDGNKKKGLGGGNCQISSTLYNAVLSVPSLSVIERHEHSNNVPYVKKGKDAAVAYGSYDFKFSNNSGNDIKLVFNVSSDYVTATIYKLE